MPLLLALAAAAFTSAVAMRMTDPIVGPLSHDFAVEAPRIALFATAFALPYALFQLVFGPLGDRYGKARIVRLAVAVLALLIAAAALAPDYQTMLALRFASGAFGGAIIPLGLATIGDRFALPERQVMLSRFMLATLSGQIAGTFLTGILAEFVPWRGVFAGYAALAAAVAAALFVLPSEPRGRAEPLTLAGALGRYGAILAGPMARMLLPIVFVEGGLFFAFLAFTPAYLSEVRGLSPGDIGLTVACYGLGGMLFATFVKPILRLLGSYGMVVAGGLIAGAAVGLLALPLPLPAYMAGAGAVGFAFTLIHNNLQTRATELAPEARGSAIAIFACLLFFGNGIGPIVMKLGVDRLGYVPTFELLGAGMALFGLGAAAVLRAGERTIPDY